MAILVYSIIYWSNTVLWKVWVFRKNELFLKEYRNKGVNKLEEISIDGFAIYFLTNKKSLRLFWNQKFLI